MMSRTSFLVKHGRSRSFWSSADFFLDSRLAASASMSAFLSTLLFSWACTTFCLWRSSASSLCLSTTCFSFSITSRSCRCARCSVSNVFSSSSSRSSCSRFLDVKFSSSSSTLTILGTRPATLSLPQPSISRSTSAPISLAMSYTSSTVSAEKLRWKQASGWESDTSMSEGVMDQLTVCDRKRLSM
ncbi:hypothetical protein EYF80_051203 [Liparis tanakae]|uniref:Uncharacterized protein n=1 Tax=Liparis tanakae TaxID=230148 RepID=A0A4Z2FCL8_9TELE|nr:hypothetical protein EYF80_051203 [Liparis tanakae]